MTVRTRESLEQERRQLERARRDWLRWYGGFDRGYLERTGERLRELQAELAQHEGNGDDEHGD